MSTCAICGENLPAGTRACPMCGTSVATGQSILAETTSAAPAPGTAPPSSGFRSCPSCGKHFAPDYADMFCTCGVELVAAAPPPAADAPGSPGIALKGPSLVLYSAERRPVHAFTLAKDAILVGRLDAVAGTFPDIDLADYLEPAVARKVSRKHALILRSRQTQRFSIRPLAGNTGTQIEEDMVLPMQDYPLKSGTRIILGGAVRFKFEA